MLPTTGHRATAAVRAMFGKETENGVQKTTERIMESLRRTAYRQKRTSSCGLP